MEHNQIKSETEAENQEQKILLIECPACHASLSSQAISCPHCGHPMKEKESSLLGFLGIFLAIIFAVIIMSLD